MIISPKPYCCQRLWERMVATVGVLEILSRYWGRRKDVKKRGAAASAQSWGLGKMATPGPVAVRGFLVGLHSVFTLGSELNDVEIDQG